MSRAIRRELREIQDQLPDREDVELTDEELQTIAGALADSDARTRSKALRVLKTDELDEQALPVARLKPYLVTVIKDGIDADEARPKRNAERAALMLSQQGVYERDLAEDFTHLGESMLAVPDPRLQAGGAALLIPSMLSDEYGLGKDQVDDLKCHVQLTFMFVENFERQVDVVTPALFVLGQARDELSGSVEAILRGVDLSPLLTSHREKARSATVSVLESLAANEPEFVEEYVLELTLRLDDDPEIAVFAARALVEVSKGTDAEALRPALHVLPSTLERDDEGVVTAALIVASAIAAAEPDWLERLPMDRIEDLGRSGEVRSPRDLGRIVQILGAHAASTGSARLAESALSIGYESIAVVDRPQDLVPALRAISGGLRDAILAGPEVTARSVPAEGCWPETAILGPEIPVVQIAKALDEEREPLPGGDPEGELNADGVSPPGAAGPDADRQLGAGSGDRDDEAEDGETDSKLTRELVAYWTTVDGLKRAVATDSSVAASVAEVVTDDDEPTSRRRLLAATLHCVTLLDDPDEDVVEVVQSVGDRLQDADDDDLSRIGLEIATK